MQKLLSLFVSLVLALSAGAIGSFYTTSAVVTWYPTLVKPMLNPPSWVFAPVWTLLYVLMATAAWIVWEKRGKSRMARVALAVYAVQLVLNALWSVAFFGMKSPPAGLLVIGALLIAILATTILFGRISRVAGSLFFVYLAWVLFATYLNVSIVLLNPSPSSPTTLPEEGTAGAHCGGFIQNAPTCATGFHCQLEVSRPDTGGVCVPDEVAGQ